MALKILWSASAKKGIANVIEYLEENRTAREILNLESKIKDILSKIVSNPELFPKSAKIKDVHKAIVDKNNYLIYRVDLKKKQIQIITFRGTKQKPKH